MMVADVDEERAASVAATVPGARAAADAHAHAHALIADPDVDVVIASHDTTHAGLAVAAVRAGKPVHASVTTLRAMDEIRGLCGIAFPGESPATS